MYKARRLTITYMHGDNEFEEDNIREVCFLALMHICVMGEHIPVIERSIRIMKEYFRCVYHGIPYRSIPYIVVISLMK